MRFRKITQISNKTPWYLALFFMKNIFEKAYHQFKKKLYFCTRKNEPRWWNW